MATKRGLRPANCVGVIDSDYRGEIIVALHNDTEKCETIHSGDRIAQMVIMPYLGVQLNEVEELNSTERGNGGFGSTGVSSEVSVKDAEDNNIEGQMSIYDVCPGLI